MEVPAKEVPYVELARPLWTMSPSVQSAPVKPADLVGRDSEWELLSSMWNTPKPELVIVLGRRRVGKSYLLGRFAQAVGGLYYQATRRTEAEQLARLSRAIGDRFADSALQRGVGFPDWEALFGYVTDRAGADPFLLVLDEFPYLSDAAPALPSIVQGLWDHAWAKTRLKIILSGSHITAMTRLEAADQPLYGRRTHRLVLAPFGPKEVGAFVPHYTPRQRLTMYGVVGGLPGHLSLLDPERNIAENAAALLLHSSGRLVDEAQHMLDAFLGDAAVHYSILEAIASGEHTWKGITSRIGRSGGAALRPLEWLVDMQVVVRSVPVTESSPQRSKRSLYRITDPYVGFWHRFVAPLVAAGSVGLVPPEQLWERAVAPRLDDYMGGVFETACRQAVRRGAVTLPFAPTRVGEWWNTNSREQIDIVALGGDTEVLIGECKWGAITGHDLTMLERRAGVLAAELGGRRQMHLALFSGRGAFDEETRQAIARGGVLGFGAGDIT